MRHDGPSNQEPEGFKLPCYTNVMFCDSMGIARSELCSRNLQVDLLWFCVRIEMYDGTLHFLFREKISIAIKRSAVGSSLNHDNVRCEGNCLH